MSIWAPLRNIHDKMKSFYKSVSIIKDYKDLAKTLLDTSLDIGTGLYNIFIKKDYQSGVLTLLCPIVSGVICYFHQFNMIRNSEEPTLCHPSGIHFILWRIFSFIPAFQPSAYLYLDYYFKRIERYPHRIRDYAKLLKIRNKLQNVEGRYEAAPQALIQLYTLYMDPSYWSVYIVIKICLSLNNASEIFYNYRIEKVPYIITKNRYLSDEEIGNELPGDESIFWHLLPYRLEVLAFIGLRFMSMVSFYCFAQLIVPCEILNVIDFTVIKQLTIVTIILFLPRIILRVLVLLFNCRELIRNWKNSENSSFFSRQAPLHSSTLFSEVANYIFQDLKAPMASIILYKLSEFQWPFWYMHIENIVAFLAFQITAKAEFLAVYNIIVFSLFPCCIIFTIVRKCFVTRIFMSDANRYSFGQKVVKGTLAVFEKLKSDQNNTITSMDDFADYFLRGIRENWFESQEGILHKSTRYDKLESLFGYDIDENPKNSKVNCSEFRQSFVDFSEYKISNAGNTWVYKKLTIRKLMLTLCLKYLAIFIEALDKIQQHTIESLLRNPGQNPVNLSDNEKCALRLIPVIYKILGVALINDNEFISVQFNELMNFCKFEVEVSNIFGVVIKQEKLKGCIKLIAQVLENEQE